MTAKEIFEMAFEPGAAPDFVHPSKKKWIETGDEELDALLPELSKKGQSYLELITSQNYQELIKRIEHYTGIKTEKLDLPSLTSLAFQAIQKVQGIESQRKHFFETLALDVVLELPEFKMVKEAFYNDEVKFDVKLGKPDLENAIFEPGDQEPETDANLSPVEDINTYLAQQLANVTPAHLQRQLANLMIQGQAVYKTFLFNQVSDKLNQIDPDLTNLYGIIASVGQLGFWGAPMSMGPELSQSDMQMGSEEVSPEGDIYVIKARAVLFPILIHEVVKGIYEWISLNPELQGEMSKDTAGAEMKDLVVGPELTKIFMSYIPADKQELVPLVHKKFLVLPRDDVKEVFAQSQKGKEIMQQLVNDAETEWEEYQQQKEGLDKIEQAIDSVIEQDDIMDIGWPASFLAMKAKERRFKVRAKAFKRRRRK